VAVALIDGKATGLVRQWPAASHPDRPDRRPDRSPRARP